MDEAHDETRKKKSQIPEANWVKPPLPKAHYTTFLVVNRAHTHPSCPNEETLLIILQWA